MSFLPQHFPLVEKSRCMFHGTKLPLWKEWRILFVGFVKPEPCSRFRFHQSIFMIEMSVIRSLFFPPSSSLSLSLPLSFPPFPLNMIRIQYCSSDACVCVCVCRWVYLPNRRNGEYDDEVDQEEERLKGWKEGEWNWRKGWTRDGGRREDWKGRKRGNVL